MKPPPPSRPLLTEAARAALAAREAREAQALRDNLKRRKEQQRETANKPEPPCR